MSAGEALVVERSKDLDQPRAGARATVVGGPARDRVTAGRIRCASRSRAPPSPAGEYMPVPGSQPSFTEKPMISSITPQHAA